MRLTAPQFMAACTFIQKSESVQITLTTHLPPRMVADTLWLMTARSRGASHWVENSHCTIEQLDIDGHPVPVSHLTKSQWKESYVSSLRSAWLRYPHQEAKRHLTAGQLALYQAASCLILGPISLLMRAARLDQAAILANHLISTNLYPPWLQTSMPEVLWQAQQHYPDRPIVLRNLCPAVHPELFEQLRQQGWQMIPARQVYLCDPADPAVWQHNHVRKDARLLADQDMELVAASALQREDIPALRQLFRQLFIEKHSCLNPDFSDDFFEFCLETQFLDCYALRWQGKWVGILGVYAQADSGWMTTPLIGYDTQLPKELGIYRRLMALLLKLAKDKQMKLHYSSGAAQFKLARGGQPALEYTAVYSQHLPLASKLSLKLFARVLQRCAPAILSYADKQKPG